MAWDGPLYEFKIPAHMVLISIHQIFKNPGTVCPPNISTKLGFSKQHYKLYFIVGLFFLSSISYQICNVLT
jgi:hypothetical protein